MRDGIAEDLEESTFGEISVETDHEHFPHIVVLNLVKVPLFAESVNEVEDGRLDLFIGEFLGIERGD